MKKILLGIALWGSVATAAQVVNVKVQPVDGYGGDTGAVVGRCQVKAGSTYDPIAVSRDVTQLRASGEFDEINADVVKTLSGDVEVIYFVKRKLRYLPPLKIEGNDYFSESKIAKEAELKDGNLYGEADLAAAAAKVRTAYQKKHFPDAKVTPRAEIISGNDARIVFLVDEGKRSKIKGFSFAGAEHLSAPGLFGGFGAGDDDLSLIGEGEVRAAIGDYPWWNPYGWFADRPVTRDQLSQCCAKIAAVYRKHGYLDVKVSGPVAKTAGEGAITMEYTVDEGKQYRIGGISIKGLTRYSEGAVKSKSDLPKSGTIAGSEVVAAAADRIRIAVGSGALGLADTAVETRIVPSSREESAVDIVYVVTEGVPVAINEVKIRGNDYTKDRVIRREIALGPGDLMLEDRADRSKKRLENLNYFSRVAYYLEPTELGKREDGAEYRNLVYEVDEQNTGSFMVGVGASSVDSVYISAEVNQNNFDLFAPSKLFRGAGQKGRAYVAWGPRYQSAELGVVEPYFLDRMLELSVDVYRRLRWYDEYDLVRSGALVSLAYPVKFWPTWQPFGRLGFGISGEYIEFDDVESGDYMLSDGRTVSFTEEERLYDGAFEPVLKLFWAKDSRDNFRIPTSGHRTRLFLDLSPAGDNKYWRLGFNHRSYFKVWKKYNHVLMTALRAETIDGFSDEIPIYNRMFLGGPKSIRGIEYRNVAPLASKGGEYVPWGGQSLFALNFEYTVPIVKMFRLAFFSDIGSVGEDEFDLDFSDTFAWTVGVGLRLDIPMFPIRLDFASPIEKPDHAEEEVFSFTIGYDF